jgi:hypothetical protein
MERFYQCLEKDRKRVRITLITSFDGVLMETFVELFVQPDTPSRYDLCGGFLLSRSRFRLELRSFGW